MDDQSNAAGVTAKAMTATAIPISPSSPKLYSLPNEILFMIAETLRASSLENLAATSRKLHAIVMRTRCRDTRMGSLYEYNPYDMDDDEERWACYYEPVLHGSIARLYETLEISWLPIGHWIKRLEVEVLHEERMVSSNLLVPMAGKAPEASGRLHYARLVGKIFYLLPGLRELIMDMSMGILPCPHSSPLHYLFGCDDFSEVSEIPAFRYLERLDCDIAHLPEAIACLPTLERLSLEILCVKPDTCHWQTNPNIKWLQLSLSASALIMDTTSPNWDRTNDHLFNFISSCSSLQKLDIDLSKIWYPASAHVEYAHAFVKSLAAAAPTLTSLRIESTSPCSACLNHILPVHGALQYFRQLKHLNMPQEMLFRATQLPTIISRPFASLILPDSLESLEIQYPYGSIFRFLGCLVRERPLYLSALKKVTISCSKARGMRYARKDGKGGMLHLWNRSAVVKDLCNSGMGLSLRYTDWDAPEAWKDVYERAALALERFAMSLGSEISPDEPLIIWDSKGFVW